MEAHPLVPGGGGGGHDNWYWFVYNDRWQMVGTWRAPVWAYDSGNDTGAKELFVNHQAGFNGMGGSSYIDDVILRDADLTNGFIGDDDGTLESRLYYLQNWRADVVATVAPAYSTYDPPLVDQVRYSSYGVPWAVSLADVVPVGGDGTSPFSPEGELTYDDVIAFYAWYGDDNLNADIVGIGGARCPTDRR